MGDGVGLKLGDTERVNDVVNVMFDGDRVSYRRHEPAKIKAAATVAGRINPSTKRLNRKQIEALGILADSGWISKDTAFSVAMNGGWPPGKDPNTIISLETHNDIVYGERAGGGFFVVDRGSKRSPPAPTREITREKMDWAVEGYRMHHPTASDAEAETAAAFMAENPSFIREHYATGSQEQMRQFGMHWALAKQTEAASKRHADNDFKFWTGSGDKDDYTDAVTVMFSKTEDREALAANLGLKMVNIPDPFNATQEIDPEEIKQAVRDGVYGVGYVQYADKYEIQDLAEILLRDAAMQEAVANTQPARDARQGK